MTPEQNLKLIEEVAEFEHDPEGFVDYAYTWGKGPLEGEEGPRTWQRRDLRKLGEHLRNPATRHTPFRLARSSGHGIGKSAFISFVVNWGMSTFEDCKVLITANTDTQLRTKTMPEVTKWMNLSITAPWFEVNATSIVSRAKGHDKTWRGDAVPWSEHNTEAFAGLHNKKRRIIVIFDEASNIADKIWEVTEGALTDEETEIIWIAFGNPTRNTGRFKDCFGRFKHRWDTDQIDSRDVEGTNKKQIEEWIKDWGINSDFVKVRVRGMFPNMSAKQFIGVDLADAAFGKHLREGEYSFAPKILTVDPAWEGDDELVIGLRQGLMFKILRIIPKNDNDMVVGNLVAQLEDEHQADAVFIDAGYGTGIVSFGRTMHRNWQLVWFGSDSTNPGYFNKRDEMYGGIKKWLQEGGAIEKDQQLYNEIVAAETIPRADGKIKLEAKKEIKARLGFSPGRADALALSFAYPVAHKPRTILEEIQTGHHSDYDVHHSGGNHKSDFDPFR